MKILRKMEKRLEEAEAQKQEAISNPDSPLHEQRHKLLVSWLDEPLSSGTIKARSQLYIVSIISIAVGKLSYAPEQILGIKLTEALHANTHNILFGIMLYFMYIYSIRVLADIIRKSLERSSKSKRVIIQSGDRLGNFIGIIWALRNFMEVFLPFIVSSYAYWVIAPGASLGFLFK